MIDIASACIVLTALLAYLNHRFIGLPSTIGAMAAALLLSLSIIGLDLVGVTSSLRAYPQEWLTRINFSEVLMQGMLSMLLFAGALHVDLSALRSYRWQVAALALLGTVLSTIAVGFGTWAVLPAIGLQLPLIHCLLFGALISPTDPIAVMGIVKTAGAPKNLELVIAGESLFNDGIGVVLFSLLLGVLVSGETPTFAYGAQLLVQEAGGGLLFGVVLGFVTFWLLKSVDNYQVEVLLTLAAVTGGYTLATRLHVSGPLAMVVVGLVVGNGGRAFAMSDITRRYVDLFWELIDEILNAVLFVLIGLQLLVMTFTANIVAGALILMALTLLVRGITVGLPVVALPRAFHLPRGSAWVLTFGGLRGGISVALALSLPPGSSRDVVLALTYCIVVMSILGQGLTIGRVTRWAICTN